GQAQPRRACWSSSACAGLLACGRVLNPDRLVLDAEIGEAVLAHGVGPEPYDRCGIEDDDQRAEAQRDGERAGLTPPLPVLALGFSCRHIDPHPVTAPAMRSPSSAANNPNRYIIENANSRRAAASSCSAKRAA